MVVTVIGQGDNPRSNVVFLIGTFTFFTLFNVQGMVPCRLQFAFHHRWGQPWSGSAWICSTRRWNLGDLLLPWKDKFHGYVLGQQSLVSFSSTPPNKAQQTPVMRSIGPSDEIQRISRCGTCQDVAKDSTCSVKSRCAGCGGTWCPGPRCDGLESRWFPWFFLIPKNLCRWTGFFKVILELRCCPTDCSKGLVHFPLNLNSGGVWRHSRMRRIHAILLFQLQELQKQAGSWNRNSILHQVYSTQECSNCHKTMTFSLLTDHHFARWFLLPQWEAVLLASLDGEGTTCWDTGEFSPHELQCFEKD